MKEYSVGAHSNWWDTPDCELEAYLNQTAKAGWRIVSVTRQVVDHGMNASRDEIIHHFIWEREIAERPMDIGDKVTVCYFCKRVEGHDEGCMYKNASHYPTEEIPKFTAEVTSD